MWPPVLKPLKRGCRSNLTTQTTQSWLFSRDELFKKRCVVAHLYLNQSCYAKKRTKKEARQLKTIWNMLATFISKGCVRKGCQKQRNRNAETKTNKNHALIEKRQLSFWRRGVVEEKMDSWKGAKEKKDKQRRIERRRFLGRNVEHNEPTRTINRKNNNESWCLVFAQKTETRH